jgi:hypothetical protein
VEDRRAGLARVARVHHSRENLVVHFHQLGGVLRLVERFRDDHGDVIADVAGLALRKRRMRRLLHRLAIDIGDQPAAGQSTYFGPGEIIAREDRDDAGRCTGLARIDALDRRMCVRRAHEVRVGLPGQADVVSKSPAAGKKAIVLLALDGLTDHGCVHGVLLDLVSNSSSADKRR